MNPNQSQRGGDPVPGLLVVDHPDHRLVTLDRATKANALTADMMAALGEAAAGAPPGRPLVLRSASPRVFCAGADIGEFSAGAGHLARQEHALLAMIDALSGTAAPVVAVARGRASGAGLALLCLADVVIAGDDLAVAAPEIVFGMYPVIVEAVLRSRLSPALSVALCAGGRTVDAAAAFGLGIATELVPADGFEPAAGERLRHYLARGTALAVARDARLAGRERDELLERLRRVAPMMGRNYADPAVRRRIDDYLATLGRRA